MLQSMGLQRVRHDLATEQQQQVMPVLVAGGKTTNNNERIHITQRKKPLRKLNHKN